MAAGGRSARPVTVTNGALKAGSIIATTNGRIARAAA
jgi:hypothetical protein